MGRKRREKSVFMKYFAIFFFSVATAYVVRKFLKFQKIIYFKEATNKPRSISLI